MPPLLLKLVFLQNRKNGIQIWTRTEGEDYSYLDKSVHLNGKVLTPEEDEEQLIMRRMRNSVDELRRGYRSIRFFKFPFFLSFSKLIVQVARLQNAEGEDKSWEQQGHQGGNRAFWREGILAREGVAHRYAKYLSGCWNWWSSSLQIGWQFNSRGEKGSFLKWQS